MSVSSINNGLSKSYEQLSSMKQINSAADNPAGLSIVEKMESQTNGYDVGNSNGKTGQDLIKTAEGGLASIQDNLQRIRELAVQASNAIYAPEDKAAIQQEVDQLKQGIQDAAKGTEFNTLKLLDGSMADMNLALNPDGTGMEIQMYNSTLESLGIEDFDVTGNFNIEDIDKAIEKVSEARSSLGATYNALEHATAYSSLASENLTAASSRIEDLDVEKAVSEMKKQEVLDGYALMVQKLKMEQEAKKLNVLNVNQL